MLSFDIISSNGVCGCVRLASSSEVSLQRHIHEYGRLFCCSFNTRRHGLRNTFEGRWARRPHHGRRFRTGVTYYRIDWSIPKLLGLAWIAFKALASNDRHKVYVGGRSPESLGPAAKESPIGIIPKPSDVTSTESLMLIASRTKGEMGFSCS